MCSATAPTIGALRCALFCSVARRGDNREKARLSPRDNPALSSSSSATEPECIESMTERFRHTGSKYSELRVYRGTLRLVLLGGEGLRYK